MRKYSFKWGKFLFFRWLIVSWILQGIHVYDNTERMLRVSIELLLIFIVIFFVLFNSLSITVLLFNAIVIHTMFWLLNSHWLVGYREVNKNFKGKGIDSIVEYSEYVKKVLMPYSQVKFIGVFGSLCRKVYHERSDLDLRVVQANGINIRLFFAIQYLRFVGIWKYKIPLDLKLVDSISYLKQEMREDEYPIVLYSLDINFYSKQISFHDFKEKRLEFIKKK